MKFKAGQTVKFRQGFFGDHDAIIVDYGSTLRGDPGYQYWTVEYEILIKIAGEMIRRRFDEIDLIRDTCEHFFQPRKSGFWIFKTTDFVCERCGTRRPD